MHNSVRIAIIGYGYWGPNLVRNFAATKGCTVAMVVDARAERHQLVQQRHPGVQTATSAQNAINNPDIDAVVIATPVFTHYQLAKDALNAGKHVLLEKPMTSSAAEAEELINLAEQKGLSLMVDHTFLYTGAVQRIRKMVDDGELGDLHYFDSTRINLGLFQQDINVLWDLAPHDISILFHLVKEKPRSVCATGVSHTFNGLENLAYLTVNYDTSFIAHFTCSWTSPVKIRNILIGGSSKMVVFNDVEPTEKIKVYDTGFDVRNDEEKQRLLIDYRAGDIYVPKLPQQEALAGMAADFIASITDKKKPLSDYQIGYDVVKVLEAAQQSIKENGKEVLIKL